uniref:EF-hand domain-containing protein n=1 Tax=Ascaris lumbricoides TaxID=6252 RepID=A0A9J2NZB2_ASCLU
MDELTTETERLFDLCDRENKGYLTVNDLKVACPQLDDEACGVTLFSSSYGKFECLNHGFQEIDFIFASLDADRSGRIDRREFLGGFQNALCRGESEDKICSFKCHVTASMNWKITRHEKAVQFSGMKRRASVVDIEHDCGTLPRRFDFATVYEGASETENNDSFSLPENIKGSPLSDVAVYNSDSDAYSSIDFSLPCQDEVLLLYEQLQSSGMPQILHRFEKVVGSFCKEIRDQKYENVRLQHVFESERQSYSRRMLEVESEIDQHISNAERKVRDEERRRLCQEKEEMRMQLEQEMMELKNNLLAMQKMEDAIKKESTKGEQTLELKAKLQGLRCAVSACAPELIVNVCDVVGACSCTSVDLTGENQRLKSNLAESQLELAVIKSELVTIKSEYETRKEEMLSDNEAIMERAKQSENLRRQLRLLYDANKKLHDTNDSLREALDQRTLACKQLNLRTPSPLPFPREVSAHCIPEPRDVYGQTSACSTDEDADSGLSLAIRYDSYCSGDLETECRRTSKTAVPNNNQGFGEADGPPERTFRIVMCGDASVGKSSIVTRIVKGVFTGNLPSTLGVDFQVKNARIDDKNVAIQLWDTAGQESACSPRAEYGSEAERDKIEEPQTSSTRFRSLCKSYFRRADGAILVYDCTMEQTFLGVRDWIQTIKESTLKPIPVLICANKTDLRRQFSGNECRGFVSTEEGRSLALAMGVLFAECSAFDGSDVEEVLLTLTRELMATEDVEVRSAGVILTQKKSSSSCC